MMETVANFLEAPTGKRYDAVIAKLNVTAAKIVFSKLNREQQATLVTAGVDAFRHSDLFYCWLWSTIESENAKPIDLIREGNLERVMHMLGRIQFGVYH